MKKTAIYIRVSNINGQRFDSQLHELNRWIELHKPERITWYKDKFTGTTMDRPELYILSMPAQRIYALTQQGGGLIKLACALFWYRKLWRLSVLR
jgi:hypothetical protein